MNALIGSRLDYHVRLWGQAFGVALIMKSAFQGQRFIIYLAV